MKTPWYGSVDLRADHIVLDGLPVLHERGTASPPLGPCLLWPRSPISATAELLLRYLTLNVFFHRSNSTKSSAAAEMGDCGHNRHGPKRGGGLICPFRGQLEPCQCGLGRDLLPYQVASSSIQPFGHNRHGPKIGWEWVCPFFLGELAPH